ncbi:hypothetical protein [Flavobacterium sp. '19STA2R22 D10 B1']|uniref:hypothetical protein n=1 Tax=Flavobacterium aerium TaxID=3037261 RepID=UPI00278C48BC|nr:hypothetical protein [Flavobacterium sp. '19STA2R22 D10 B1']
MSGKIYYYLLLFLCFIYSCSHYENGLEEIKNTNLKAITTVSLEEAKAYLNHNKLFNTEKKAKEAKDTLSTIFVTLFQDQISHEPLINSDQKITVIPAVIAYPKYYSRVILFKMENEIIARVFSMRRDQSSTDENFTGVILITDLEGNFSSGYNVKNGIITHQLVYNTREQGNKGVIGFIPDDPIDGGILDPVKVDGSTSPAGNGGIRDVWLAYGPLTGPNSNPSNSGWWNYGGSSGGAGNNPEEAATTPCKEMKKKANDAEFKGKLNELKASLNVNYETGFLMTTNGTSTSYEAIEGNSNTHEIELSPTSPISGYMHTHVVGDSKTGFSTFSIADIKAIYQLYQGGNIQNTSTFTATVVSSHGTTYVMMIDNASTFNNFGNASFSNNTVMEQMENLYDYAFQNMSLAFNVIQAREFALLTVLEGSGLKLMKANADFSQWNSISKATSGLNIVVNNCN